MPAPRGHLLRLSGVAAGMFAFGFALVPLYRFVCQITGANLQAGEMRIAEPGESAVDTSRWVTVQFTTSVSGGRDWTFRADAPQVRVHPGELTTVTFFAENPADQALVARAVPSIAPLDAAKHLRKTECFCFQQQAFAPREGRSMPVRFLIDPELPADVGTVTLSYTFFDVTELAQN